MDYIAQSFAEGFPWMHSILLTAILALAIVIERFIFLFFRYNINARAFMAQVQKLVMGNNIDRAIKLCNAAPNAALARVVKAGLTRANKGEREIHNALEEATLDVIPLVQKRTGNLQAVANIATMLGLLGTVIGLIGAFQDLATVSADKRQEALGRNIALAMNTTAFGLIVAIPCLFAYIFLANVSKKIIDEIDQYSVKLENLLSYRLRGGDMASVEEERK
ncbi:MAG: MotA/TolQ/ExbB proton channel family protein [Deltaproteobacteria bacterium]|nr:MotA/TolQ/ExbB proton channel family protein [Deltaproteobacteria bacterium]